MISLPDILKLLDQIPIWKTLSQLPKRVTELEARLAAIDGRAAPPEDPALRCPSCGASLTFISEQPAATGGRMGVKERSFRCETCGHTTTRNWVASRGYL